MKRRSILRGAALSLLVLAGPMASGADVLAQDSFPSKTIEIVNLSGAGGGSDIFLRMAALRARKSLKTEIQVLPKPGGLGVNAMNYVNGKPRDGYTVMSLLPGHLISIANGKAPIGFDELVPLVRGTEDPQLLMVAGNGSFAGIADVIAEAKRRPIKIGGTHVGGIDHITAVSFIKKVGAQNPIYIPFKSGSELVTNLIGGNIEVAVLNFGEAESQIASGEILAAVVLAKDRMSVLPDTPTSHDAGFDLNISLVRGMAVLKGTPEDRIAALESAFLKSMNHSVYQNYLSGSGLAPSSIADRQAWSAQISDMYVSIQETLKELGMAQ